MSIITCSAEFAMKKAVVLIHFFSVTAMSQKALTGVQEKMPTRTVSVPHAMLIAPIIFVAKSTPGVGKRERYSSKIDTLITAMATA